jgi:PAS domain S-box-containing protein
VEAKLRVHKRLIESILATMPGGVLVINGGDRVLLTNQSFHKIFSIGKRALKGKTLAQVMPVNQLLNHYQSVKQGQKETSSLEFRKQVKGAEKIITSRIIPMDGGRTLLTFNDVSKEREEEEKLYLTDRLASLGEMAAGLAHEINNPLTGILALSQLLDDSDLPDEYREDVTFIHAEAKRAAEIVKNVLLFTRNNNYENGQSSANEVVRDVLRLREYEEKAGNIRVVTRLEDNLPAIAINKFQLQQVFLNIISNAEAAIRQTGRPGTLRVTTENAGRYVNIHFADNGCGIKKQVMPHIFDPFFTTKEIGKGTGLGLSICYGIVTKHGGEMSVRSRADQGSTFTIKMPVAE